jgi:outer membrane protein
MQKNLRLPALGATFVTLALACGAAQAQHTFKFGAVRYDSHSRTTGVTGIGIPPGADAEVGDATTALFTYEYAVSPNFGVELVLGVPPKITAKAKGSVAFLGEVLTARNVAPAVLVNYHFGQPGQGLRPYVGVGVNYTKFTDVKTPYGWDVKLSDSAGLLVHGGVDWAINKNWGMFASIARVDVKSNLVATGAVVLRTTIDFRPWTYEAGFSYRF